MQPARQDLPVTPGTTYRDTVRIMQPEFVYRAITGIEGAPVQLTAPGHGLLSDWPIWVRGVQGMTELNREPTRQLPLKSRVVSPDVLEINAMSAAGLRPSGGEVIYRRPVNLAEPAAAMIVYKAGLPLFTLALGSGLSITARGTIQRVLTAEQTSLLIGGDLTYTLDVTYGGPTVTRYFTGSIGTEFTSCAGDAQVLTVGEQGPPGVGAAEISADPNNRISFGTDLKLYVGADPDLVFQRPAGTVLSALRVVYESQGRVFLLSADDEAHADLVLGLTLTSSDQGAPVAVKRAGVVDDQTWSWVPGQVWLGANGNLTQTPPADGVDLAVGTAVSATRLVLNLQQPLYL